MLRIAAAVIIAVLAACSTAELDSVEHGPGWRKGIVVQVGDRASLGPPLDSDCREQARADADPKQRYVEVQYFVGRHAHLRIVPIAEAVHVSEGDAIFFRSFGCTEARVAGPPG